MFHVRWIQEALDDLTNIWLRADGPLREAITAAAHELEQELKADPYRKSESREQGDEERVKFVYPLGARFEIDLAQRRVWIMQVWRYRRRGE
jgi:hypothetical protein